VAETPCPAPLEGASMDSDVGLSSVKLEMTSGNEGARAATSSTFSFTLSSTF
jgi:hypothetical protein